jgi:hypothetical protein
MYDADVRHWRHYPCKIKASDSGERRESEASFCSEPFLFFYFLLFDSLTFLLAYLATFAGYSMRSPDKSPSITG